MNKKLIWVILFASMVIGICLSCSKAKPVPPEPETENTPLIKETPTYIPAAITPTGLDKATLKSTPTLEYPTTMPITHAHQVSHTMRIEVPWLGPITDYTGFTTALAAGDIDQDDRTELIVTLTALDIAPEMLVNEPEFLTYTMAVKVFKVMSDTYELDHLIPAQYNSYRYGIATTSTMAIINSEDNPVLLIGSNRWYNNQNGWLGAMVYENNTWDWILDTVCLGSIYRLDSVRLQSTPVMFASTEPHFSYVRGDPELDECEENNEFYAGNQPALVRLDIDATGFNMQRFIITDTTLLLEKLPNSNGNLYRVGSDWSGDVPRLSVNQITDSDLVASDILPNYEGDYVVDLTTADLDGDNLNEILVLWGNSTYRPMHRSAYDTVKNLHLDIYQWQEGDYQLMQRTAIPSKTWSLVSGDIDADLKDEVLFGTGMILELENQEFVMDTSLAEHIDTLGECSNYSPSRFSIVDIDDDRRNETVVLVRSCRDSIPDDVWVRMVEREGIWPPDEAYKAAMPDTGAYYVYILQLTNE